MTLERCEIYLDRCFGYGMAYVALSRAKNLKGLRIIGWNPMKIQADPIIQSFYKEIEKPSKMTAL
jgi:ATP-dependent DNA helicase PIF1